MCGADALTKDNTLGSRIEGAVKGKFYRPEPPELEYPAFEYVAEWPHKTDKGLGSLHLLTEQNREETLSRIVAQIRDVAQALENAAAHHHERGDRFVSRAEDIQP